MTKYEFYVEEWIDILRINKNDSMVTVMARKKFDDFLIIETGYFDFNILNIRHTESLYEAFKYILLFDDALYLAPYKNMELVKYFCDEIMKGGERCIKYNIYNISNKDLEIAKTNIQKIKFVKFD